MNVERGKRANATTQHQLSLKRQGLYNHGDAHGQHKLALECLVDLFTKWIAESETLSTQAIVGQLYSAQVPADRPRMRQCTMHPVSARPS